MQVVTAVVVAVAGILLVRGRVSAAVAHHGEAERVRGVHGGLVGQEVLTLDLVGGLDRVGHVRLAGERWRAMSGADVPIPPGSKVLVTAVQGTTLIVWPVGRLLDLGLERWWPDLASVEHAREVGLLPEVRIP